MSYGRVYVWTPDPTNIYHGTVTAKVVDLPRLDASTESAKRLRGRYVRVCNGGAVNELDEATGILRPVPLGDAQPNAEGNFLFEPGRGGGRVDKVPLADPDVRWRFLQASHFGEVNTYFHLDLMATYIDSLLRTLGVPSLPPITAVVNAHHAATETNGVRDGVRRGERWLPFQGGHYRLPSHRFDLPEYEPISVSGEIHLGPGRGLLEYGALVEAAGGRYRANASHNAGILYHEYGHHIARYTADFLANAHRRLHRQNNRKTAIEEGTCDYWAATLLNTPHIWAWHRRHDAQEVHPRSLISSRTMADYDSKPGADPHANGTIWAATLWDVRTQLVANESDGVRLTDLLVLKTLLLLGSRVDAQEGDSKRIHRTRESFAVGLATLLQADELLNAGRHRNLILACFSARGILPEQEKRTMPQCAVDASEMDEVRQNDQETGEDLEQDVVLRPEEARRQLKHIAPEEIPASEDLYSAEALERHLTFLGDPPFSLIAAGDIMLGGRAREVIAEYGADYPFSAVLPLLRRADLVVGNLEGPLARKAPRVHRTYSYRVNPDLALSLTRAGIRVVTLANNHLLDCGRAGVQETLDALARAEVAPLGAGVNKNAAHAPVIRQIGSLRVGLLDYYWNQRCAATTDLPGGAMDESEDLSADIHSLRSQVDRIVVFFHWGVPYEREPSSENRAKAHFAIECGADVIIGHHPHILQPLEIYRGCPIFYSIGNFAFGSGNSRGEGALIGLRFEESQTLVTVYPLYVKNRDSRVNYQPRVLAGTGAERILSRLADISGSSGQRLEIQNGRATLQLPWPNPARQGGMN